jgi:hypothetical protein
VNARHYPLGEAYWEEVERYWAGYMAAYERFMAAPQDSPEQRAARAEMRRELGLRMALKDATPAP